MTLDAALLQARSGAEFAIAHALIVEYSYQLGVDLCFQDFASELQALARMYGPPGGCLVLARTDQGMKTAIDQNPSPGRVGVPDEYLGCIGVRRFSDDVCEMKRLYVRDAARGSGLGRRLAEAAIDAARAMGYRRMVLDTLATMSAARALYASLGFTEIPPYYSSPLVGATYMAFELVPGETG